MSANFSLYFIMVLLTILVIKEYYKIKKVNNRLSTLQRINKAFYWLGNQANEVRTKKELYEVMLEAAVDLVVCADKGSILILEGDGRFHFKAAKGFSENLTNLTLGKEEIFLYKVNNFTDTAIILNPAEFDKKNMSIESKSEFDKYEDLNITATISAPIHIDDKLIGVINIDSIKKDKTFTNDDLEAMNHIRNQLQIVLKNFIIQDELRYKAHHDYLTGIYNRRIFNYLLNEEIEKINKLNTKLFFILIDIDNFKKINDKYGHVTGDKALQHFTKILRKNISKNDIYARVAGDEFVILFKNSSKDRIEEVMTSIRKMLDETVINNLKVSFSYGICEIESSENLSIEEIYRIADKNMYMDKARKKEI
ncbi:sensor domain-containing diguanylate cyclase [Clostridium sp. ZS2-4]|uniref:sensor domain-containing diguanylate cyclase n=1 Tax=Clostridium sp. ZS2-4 TaxID=2987703 RepID=UPI00227BD108|nr:GGDEF domain-containing protein [Clostridium sp. ZS2-4]MCY6355696.1 GGDEF domain-containing protein [Clostridium sp. ZS2-4]